VLGVLSLTGSSWGNGTDFAIKFLGEAILLGVLVFGVRRVMRFNVLGCLLVAACISLLGAAAQLLGQPNSFYRANGYAVVMMIGLLLAWPFAAWRMRASTGGSTAIGT
jgi:peptidoglycan/LPS O-acetylase OafA/YrhL